MAQAPAVFGLGWLGAARRAVGLVGCLARQLTDDSVEFMSCASDAFPEWTGFRQRKKARSPETALADHFSGRPPGPTPPSTPAARCPTAARAGCAGCPAPSPAAPSQLTEEPPSVQLASPSPARPRRLLQQQTRGTASQGMHEPAPGAGSLLRCLRCLPRRPAPKAPPLTALLLVPACLPLLPLLLPL
jgi:hypothetical protein